MIKRLNSGRVVFTATSTRDRMRRRATGSFTSAAYADTAAVRPIDCRAFARSPRWSTSRISVILGSEASSRATVRPSPPTPRIATLTHGRGVVSGLDISAPFAKVATTLGRLADSGLRLPDRRGRRDLVEYLERALLPHALAWDRDGVLAREAAEADVVLRLLQGADETFEGQIAEAVGRDERGDFVDGPLVRDELVPRLHVDPKVAGGPDRRAADPHVDLPGTPAAKHLDDLPDRRAPDDRVVDEDDALVLHGARDGVELEEHADLAVRLLRHDERPLDVRSEE